MGVHLHPKLKQQVPWIDLPAVLCPTPSNRHHLATVTISEEAIHRYYRAKNPQPIFAAWAHITGGLPPINNVGSVLGRGPKVTLCTLKDAHACFQGVERPLQGEHDGKSVYAFILKVDTTLGYQVSMVCAASARVAPPNTVLMVLVRFNDPLQGDSVEVDRTVLRWEFVKADKRDPLLPKDYDTRYARKVW